MARSKLSFVFLCFLFFIVSCATTVRTKVNTFRLDGVVLGSGTIKVVGPIDGQSPSLEYAFYASSLRTALQGIGYNVVEAEQESDFVAFLNYSVVESDSDGYPHRSSLYAVSSVGYLGRANTAGADLIIVDDSLKRLNYERRVQLVIAHSGVEKKRVYEVTGSSRGHCSTLSVVFDEMLQAMLTGFPANNGSLNTYSVRGDANC